MKKNKIKLEAFRFLSEFGENIRAKLDNICGKTGKYDVTTELFLKRTKRENRVLIPWKAVKKHSFDIEQLESFSGGVVVEFVNEDFFDESNNSNPTYNELKKRLGSNENVSSMISIRSESGSSSSQVQRDNFKKLINDTRVLYNNQYITINESNYQDYAIKRHESGGKGNLTWSGFLFVSIRGGQQDTIETHRDKEELLFNPACEFATEEVSIDMNLVLSYFALKSVNRDDLDTDSKIKYDRLIAEIEKALKSSEYDSKAYRGNLLDYCLNHISLTLCPGKLYDPIQVEEIHIEDFNVKEKDDPRNIDLTHDEAMNFANYYWDSKQNCILTPSRPSNVFWSKHQSNMMQQNFSLQDYFQHEETISRRRKELLNKNKKNNVI